MAYSTFCFGSVLHHAIHFILRVRTLLRNHMGSYCIACTVRGFTIFEDLVVYIFPGIQFVRLHSYSLLLSLICAQESKQRF